MQSGHSYLANSTTRARSRSPSPARRPQTERRHTEDDMGDLFRDFQQSDKESINGSKAESSRVSNQKDNITPVDAVITINKSHPIHLEELPLPLQNQSSHKQLDEMAGAVRNYGSIPSSSGAGSNDQTQGSIGNVSESCTISHLLKSKSSRLTRQKSYYTPAMVDELRKRNKLYFLDPITKLKNFHGFPWKLTLQLLKLILITVQIVIFGDQRENTVEYFERSELAYKHLLLKDWSVAYETLPYPPAAGQYAVYNMSELFDHMNGVMERYYKIPEWSLAYVHLNRDAAGQAYPITLCFRANDFEEFPNGSYVVSATVMHNCTNILPLNNTAGTLSYDVQKYLMEQNFTLPFNRTLDITLTFYLRTFHLNLIETHYGPTCYNVSIAVVYTNSERSGQLLVDLTTNPDEIECEGKIMSNEAQEKQETMKAKVIAFDAIVMVICCFSTILCSRSLHRCNILRRDTADYFKFHKGKPISFASHMEYINMWYIIIICNDALTIVGTAFKIQLESRIFSMSSENYEICSILLGLGVFLTYVGILRYLGFFKSYNILILTLKTSCPHVLRFLVCAICLYIGFLICGWVIFSPYHVKFRKLSTASECLFAIVNGDDMYVTFSSLSDKSSTAIWYFLRVYLYIFIALFIYVVISVFIAVIMDNYENLKHYYADGFPETEIQAFIKEGGEMSLTEVFRHVDKENTWQNWFICLFPCLACLRRNQRSSLEYDKQELLVSI